MLNFYVSLLKLKSGSTWSFLNEIEIFRYLRMYSCFSMYIRMYTLPQKKRRSPPTVSFFIFIFWLNIFLVLLSFPYRIIFLANKTVQCQCSFPVFKSSYFSHKTFKILERIKLRTVCINMIPVSVSSSLYK